MSWLQIDVPAPEGGPDKYEEIRSAFEAQFMATMAPKDVAMFERSPEPGEYVFYFSPAAETQFALWISSLGAKECSAPPRAGTTLLIGHADSLDMLV